MPVRSHLHLGSKFCISSTLCKIIVIDRTKTNEELKLIRDRCCLRRNLSFPFEVNLCNNGD